MKIAAAKNDSDYALTRAEMASKLPSRGDAPEDALALKEMFTEALRNAVGHANKPLLEEVRGLRADLAANSVKSFNSEEDITNNKPVEHGAFVRFALWVENLFRS
jgi:hypothetical protein